MITSIVKFIEVIFSQIGLILGIVFVIIYLNWRNKLKGKEKEILELKYKIDHIEEDDTSKSMLRSGFFNQYHFEKSNNKRKKTMTDMLDTLKLERQFILDEVPFLGLLKK